MLCRDNLYIMIYYISASLNLESSFYLIVCLIFLELKLQNMWSFFKFYELILSTCTHVSIASFLKVKQRSLMCQKEIVKASPV